MFVLELTTIVGLGFGLISIVVSILIDGRIMSFIDLPSIFIVFGGTLASTVVAYHGKVLKSLADVYKTAFKHTPSDLKADIDMIIDIANVARRDGLLALEKMVEVMDNPFLKKGVLLIVDGANPELVKSIMEAEIYFLQERHALGQAMIDSMASYAPAYGMIGTLIGLINMLEKLSEPDTLGPSMAVALVTTFYGVVLANLVFTPISTKLIAITAAETLEKELLLEGLMSVQDGENPRIIKDKLYAFLARKDIEKMQRAGTIKAELGETQDA